MLRNLTFALLIAASCGGKDKGAPGSATTADTAGGKHAEDEHEHHSEMPPEVKAFHDLLRPLWHAEKGAQRTTDTCNAVPQFKSSADAIGKAVPPTTANADRWTEATRALAAAVPELEAACKANDAAKFEAAFSRLHDAFHALMMASREETPVGTPVPQGGGGHTGSGGGHGGHKH